MNINVNNFNTKSIKQDSQKQVKNNNDGEKSISKFEESLNDSIQSNSELKSSAKSSSKENVEMENSQIDSKISKDDLEMLKGIMYLLNMVCINNTSPQNLTLDQNVFDVENNVNMMEGISSETNTSLFKMNMEEGEIKQVLSKIGFDQASIDSKNVTIGDVIDKISTNPDNFKNLLKEGFEKLEISESFKNIFESGNFSKMLDNEQLLNNVRNELAMKLNQESGINKENFEIDNIELSVDENLLNSSVKDIENFNSVSRIKNLTSSNENDTMSNEKNQNSSNETDILKEISGEGNVNRGIENYFVENLKTNNSSRDIIYRTIDARDPVKFAKDFIENIEYMSKNNKTEMVVKLNPDQLGKMDIKYEFAKESVRLVIRAEKPEALKILDNTITDIKNMIKENHQVNLDNIHVDLQQFEFNSNSQNQRKDEAFKINNQNNTIKIDDEEIINEDKKDLRTGILV